MCTGSVADRLGALNPSGREGFVAEISFRDACRCLISSSRIIYLIFVRSDVGVKMARISPSQEQQPWWCLIEHGTLTCALEPKDSEGAIGEAHIPAGATVRATTRYPEVDVLRLHYAELVG
jgi:hypothetical protein